MIAQDLGGFFHRSKPEMSGFLKRRCLNERSLLEEAGSKGLMKIYQRRYYSEHFLCAKWAVPSRSPKVSVQPFRGTFNHLHCYLTLKDRISLRDKIILVEQISVSNVPQPFDPFFGGGGKPLQAFRAAKSIIRP